jgi:alpha-tubulin suppressor-like RCC1 family protein
LPNANSNIISKSTAMKIKGNLIRAGIFGAVTLCLSTGGLRAATTIAAGGSTSLFLKSDGSLWAMGLNATGQLGDGTTTATNRPELIVSNSVTAIAEGSGFSLFLKNDGTLWAMGSDVFGQLGDGNAGTGVQALRPEAISVPNVVRIALGANSSHSLLLKNDGSLLAMGLNSSGQLGDGSGANADRAELITNNVTAMAAGTAYSLFVKNDGSLWGMGTNFSGQMGAGIVNGTNNPTMIVPANVTAAAAGSSFSLFIENDGSLWGMGNNVQGQLGLSNNVSTNRPVMIVPGGVVAVACGNLHTLFLKNDGSLWGMGINTAGELGDGNLVNTNRPTMIVPGGVTAIAAGNAHSLFLMQDGSLWGMGQDSSGPLGDGGAGTVDLPEQIIGGIPTTGMGIYSGGAAVFFPSVGTNYVLQMNTNLNTTNWVTVTNGVPINGMIITNPPANAFFRLH